MQHDLNTLILFLIREILFDNNVFFGNLKRHLDGAIYKMLPFYKNVYLIPILVIYWFSMSLLKDQYCKY